MIAVHLSKADRAEIVAVANPIAVRVAGGVVSVPRSRLDYSARYQDDQFKLVSVGCNRLAHAVRFQITSSYGLLSVDVTKTWGL